MTVINTNTAAINAQYNLSKVQSEQENAMERLSSGLRINSASDDAAGVAIASRMNAEITGTNMAIRNAMDSQAMIDTAEGAHVEVESILQRMRELSVQSANDTYSDTDRANLQAELSQLQTEVDRIAQATNWGGKSLLNGTSLSTASSHSDVAKFQFQVGTGSSKVNSIDVSIGAISSGALGIGVGNAAAALGNASVTSSTEEAPASISIEGGKVAIVGKPEVGDVFKFDVNGTEISITYSVSDEYADNLGGLSAQMKAALDVKINDVASNPSLAGVSVSDNGDGSVTLTQSTSPTIDLPTNTDANNNSAVDIDGNVIRMSGTYEAADTFGASINGVAISITAVATDSYSDDFTGLSAQLTAAINSNATLNGTVTAVDNKDGSVTITQGSSPVIQGGETTLAKTQQTGVSFAQTSLTNATLNLKDGATHVDNEVSAFILKQEDGTETRLVGVNNGTGADAALDALKLAFDAQSTGQKNGFTMAAVASNASAITRTDGQNFSVEKAGSTHVVTVSANSTGAAADLTLDNGLTTQVTLSGGSFSTADAQMAAYKTAFDALSDTAKNGFKMYVEANTGNTNDDVLHVYRNDGGSFKIQSTSTGVAFDGSNAVVNTDASSGAATLQDDLTEDFSVASTDTTITTTAVTTTTAEGGDNSEGVLTFTGGYVSGKEYSAEIFGKTVSIVANDDDGFENSLQGLANQMTQAINDASIAGVKASVKTTGRVLIDTLAEVNNARVTKDQSTEDATITIDTTAGFNDKEVSITLGGTIDNGDTFQFDINGKTVEMKIGADGFANTAAGLKSQLKAAIDDANIEGITVTENSAATGVFVHMNIGGAGAFTNSKSTTVTNVGVTDTPNATLKVEAKDGSVSVSGLVSKGDKFDFSVEGQSFTVFAGTDGAELSAKGVANQMANMVKAANITSLEIVEDGNGSVSFSTTDVKITDAQSAKDSIAVIDAAIETINKQRADLGGVSNRLDNTVTNLSNVSANLQSSLSRIQDADFATETSNLTKSQILSQAATAMLAQANASKQGVLSLLQG